MHDTYNSTYDAPLSNIQFIIHHIKYKYMYVHLSVTVGSLISKSHFEMKFQPFRFIQFSMLWFVVVVLILILRYWKRQFLSKAIDCG